MKVWQEIQNSFAEATGFAAIIVDKDGTPLLDYSNFCQYCLEIRKTDKIADCYLSDASGGNLASETKKPVVYRCHGGLIDFAVPIMVNGQYLGAILAGQTRIDDSENDQLDFETIVKTDPKATPLYESSDKMNELYNSIPVNPLERVKAASNLLYTLANHLVEMKLVNHMQQELHEKEIELSEETRVRSEVEAALKEADLKALEAQVNPHFLFNVLNTISRIAHIENASKTQDIIYDFSDLMRYTLKRSSLEAVTLEEEFEHIKNYLNIQKVRLEDRLESVIEIDPGCKEVFCPPMIVQPFVENVINHVIEPRSIGGKIRIKAKDLEDEVVITIEDNGEGIPDDKIERLLSGTYTSDSRSTGLGIVNVNKRLKYYFGPEHGIKIERSPLGGAMIVMRIPKDSLEG